MHVHSSPLNFLRIVWWRGMPALDAIQNQTVKCSLEINIQSQGPAQDPETPGPSLRGRLRFVPFERKTSSTGEVPGFPLTLRTWTHRSRLRMAGMSSPKLCVDCQHGYGTPETPKNDPELVWCVSFGSIHSTGCVVTRTLTKYGKNR